jgi:hypothetical protein
MTLADLDADGQLDFLVTQSNDAIFTGGTLTIGLARGGSVFDITNFSIPALLGGPRAIDLDRDGDLDLIGTNICDAISGGPINCASNGRSLSVGVEYCSPAVPNSTGQPGSIEALGSRVIAQNTLRLRATGLPDDVFGFFLGSPARDDVFPLGASAGRLCVGGTSPIARFVRPGEIQNSGTTGSIEIQVDLGDLPVPLSASQLFPGATLYFQAWHRDPATSPASNLTSAVAVAFV